MPQSLSRILIHVIFSTRDREPWLDAVLRPQVFAYLAEAGRSLGCEVHRVGGVSDHVHLAIRLSRPIAIADFVKRVKQASSSWIKAEAPTGDRAAFAWQAGYGAFSVGASQLPALIAYIDGQEEHHRVKGFQEEFREFLRKYEVEFDERYVWD